MVVAIITILAALLLPVLGRARDSARLVACISNLRQIGLALQNYAGDSDGLFPSRVSAAPDVLSIPGYGPAYDILPALLRHAGTARLFTCPADRIPYRLAVDDRTFGSWPYAPPFYYSSYTVIAGIQPSGNTFKAPGALVPYPFPRQAAITTAQDALASDAFTSWPYAPGCGTATIPYMDGGFVSHQIGAETPVTLVGNVLFGDGHVETDRGKDVVAHIERVGGLQAFYFW